jgi:tyrosyl-tRNA synthetase
MRIFSTKKKEEIEALEKEHAEATYLRILQKELAKEITIRVHSEKDFDTAVTASELLFGKGTTEGLRNLTESTLLDIFSGVPQSKVNLSEINNGINIIDFLSEKSNALPSKGEARRTIKGGGISINKEKVGDDQRIIDASDLLNGKYILVQKGKKNYHLVTAV